MSGPRRYDQAVSRFREVLGGIIDDRRRDGSDRGDMLSTLLSARDADGRGPSDIELRD